MGWKLYAEEAVQAIANAIRLKLGTSRSYTISEMGDAIEAFPNSVRLTDVKVRENGDYLPPSGYTYSRVTVSVPQPQSASILITSNGVYTAPEGYGYLSVMIDVPDRSISTLTASINGLYAAPENLAYNPVVVSVPQYISASVTFSENSTYSAPLPTIWNPVTVNVWTGDDRGLVERTISTYSGSVSYIADQVFRECVMLSAVEASQCLSVGAYAFTGCISLSAVSLPACNTVGSCAFYGCSTLSVVMLPACTSVCESAFMSCRSLTTVTLPVCTTIGSSAFDFYDMSSNFRNLASVSLSAVTQIYPFAFRSCHRLTELSLPECGVIMGGAFYGCSGLTSLYAPKCAYVGCISTGSVIPGSYVGTIYWGAFAYCDRLRRIDLPSCSYIGRSAFAFCSAMSEAVLSACVSIDSDAFWRCRSMTRISLPVCEEIGSRAFCGCWSLGGMIELPRCRKLGSDAFGNDDGTWTYIPDGLITSVSLPVCEVIENGAFEKQALTSIVLPSAVSVTGYAFSSCYSLSYVEAPLLQTVASFSGSSYRYATMSFQACTKVSDHAFRSLSYLSSVTIPNCQQIGDWAFASCVLLSSLYIPNCRQIGSCAFSDCVNLTDIDLTGCERIGSSAFYGCSNLHSVSLPNVMVIGSQAFNSVPISQYELPNLSGGAYAFSGNSWITECSARMLSMVTNGMFSGCVNLSSVFMPMISAIGSYAFCGTQISGLTLPNCYYIDTQAFAYCSQLTYISVGANIDSYWSYLGFAGSAFLDCVNLYSVYIDGKVPFQGGSWAFAGTPIASGLGKIYVPYSLLSQYMSSTAWSWASSFIYSIPT